MEFESVDRYDPAGLERWRSAGSPPVPAIEIDGVASPILHVTQLAGMLGLPKPPAQEATRLGYDILLVVDSWAQNLRALPDPLIVEPTASRGRSVRNLTMNAVYPISLLPGAFASGVLDWGIVDIDETLAAPYERSADLAGFAANVHAEWGMFMLEQEHRLAEVDPPVTTPRGTLAFSTLLASQRWHISFHHRQVVEFLLGRGVEPAHRFRVEQLADLELPDVVT